MAVATYDPGRVILIWNGIPISGFADGTFIEAERSEDAFKLTVGADGTGARTRSRNKSGSVSITLLQSAAVNDSLSAQALLDELTGGGAGSLLIKDLLGTTLVEADSSWIRKLPKVDFGKDLGERQWVFDCEKLSMLAGGAL